MRILVTGNMGYVGSVLTNYLARKDPLLEIIGFDAGFFAQALTELTKLPEVMIAHQYFGDVRAIKKSVLQGVDAVVHLAGVSNDPIGLEFESLTDEINKRATLDLAILAAECGVRSFVFASSCSMYGIAGDRPKAENDNVLPLTAYAKSKIGAEQGLGDVNLNEMVVTNLRFATACGWSPRLRLDLVLNDFVAGAIVNGQIDILSDGTPYRPLIDVEDMARAIDWAINRDQEHGGRVLSANIGSNDGNYSVKGLAEAVAVEIPQTSISVNSDAPADKRSYKVDFSLFENLAIGYQPQISLQKSIYNLRIGLENLGFADKNFRNSDLVRLNVLRGHISSGRLNSSLRWRYA